jgi:hypothetical protein
LSHGDVRHRIGDKYKSRSWDKKEQLILYVNKLSVCLEKDATYCKGVKNAV